VVYALKHPAIAEDFGNFIAQLKLDQQTQNIGSKSA
jgi:hypothetical protein